MKKRNYDIIGIEVSKIKRKYSQKFSDVKVLDIDINGKKIPQVGPFHKIVLFQTLEHIIDPIKFLKNANKLLKKGGKIVVEVQNLNDFHLRINKRYRNFWWERDHINYFTPKIFKYILKKAGFKKLKIIGVQRYSIEKNFHWRITNLPQMENPTYTLSNELGWIEQYYKDHLQRKLLCDTMIIIGEKD